MSDELGFSPGDIVIDRDIDEESPAYVTALPDATAEKWVYKDEDEAEEIDERLAATERETCLN